MTEKVAHLGWVSGRKMDRAGDCVFARFAGAKCGCDIRSLDFAGILDGP
jgi:hypothetical protein